jgi:hypothetical protein
MKSLNPLILFFGLALLAFPAKTQPVACTLGFNVGGEVVPCSDPPGASVDLAAFEVWRADHYTLFNVQENGTYTVDVCTGQDGLPAGNLWPVQFTILSPTQGVVEFGTNANSNCELTFTAPESGDYLVFVHEEGLCSADIVLEEDNGIPRVTYNGGANCGSGPACEGGVLDVSNTASAICPGESSEFAVAGAVLPSEGNQPGMAISVTPVPESGTGGNEFGFNLVGFTPADFDPGLNGPYTFDRTLNGVSPDSDLPPLAGKWTFQPFVYSNEDALDECEWTEGSVVVDFLTLTNPACDQVTGCDAGTVDLASVAQFVCPGQVADFFVDDLTVPNSPEPGGTYLVFFDNVEGSGTGGPSFDDPNGDFSFFLELTFSPGVENGSFNLPVSATLLEATGEALDVPLMGEWTLTGQVYAPSDLQNPCDETVTATIDFRMAGESPCPAICQNPFPKVDQASLTANINPNNGSIVVNWEPIEGQIGCRVRATAGDIGNPTQVATFVKAGPNANQFVAPAQVLNEFTTYNFQVQCGCSQQPLIVGQYTDPISVFYIPPAAIAQAEPLVSQPERSDLAMDGRNVGKLSLPSTEASLQSLQEKPLAIVRPRNSGPIHADSFEVFPNPTEGPVNLHYTADEEGFVNLRIFDVLGKEVLSEKVAVTKGQNFIRHDLSGEKAGLYLIVVGEGRKSKSARIIRY